MPALKKMPRSSLVTYLHLESRRHFYRKETLMAVSELRAHLSSSAWAWHPGVLHGARANVLFIAHLLSCSFSNDEITE